MFQEEGEYCWIPYRTRQTHVALCNSRKCSGSEGTVAHVEVTKANRDVTIIQPHSIIINKTKTQSIIVRLEICLLLNKSLKLDASINLYNWICSILTKRDILCQFLQQRDILAHCLHQPGRRAGSGFFNLPGPIHWKAGSLCPAHMRLALGKRNLVISLDLSRIFHRPINSSARPQ